jgi:hypothetical protein
VIVVIGRPRGRIADGVVFADGPASRAALSAAAAGRSVQVVGKLGDDAVADAVVLDLARHGVGHAALLRDPAWVTPLDPGPVGPEDADPLADGPVGGVTGDRSTAPGVGLDPTDVELGLRYLTDFRVVVVAEAEPLDVIAVAAEASRWDSARLIIAIGADAAVPNELPADAIVIEAPETDPDGAFAELIGTLAAALDGSVDPGQAFRDALAAHGGSDVAAD